MVLKAIAGSDGIAVGKAYVVLKKDIEIPFKKIDETQIEYELKKITDAIATAKKEVQQIIEKVKNKRGEKDAEIFASHLAMLDDCYLIGLSSTAVKEEHLCAAAAVKKTVKQISTMFSAMDDEYFSARAYDIQDVGDRLLRHIVGANRQELSFVEPNTVIVAEDLTPSDTAYLDTYGLSGVVCESGSKTSHTVILAKSIGIPAVVGASGCLEKVKNGDTIIVDGSRGEVILNPSEDVVEKYTRLSQQYNEEKLKLNKLILLPSLTIDQKPIEILGNAGSLEDIDRIIENGADGVGLFRTEFFYMGRKSFPTEQTQFATYKLAAQKLAPKPLTIRTMDIGGDKALPYFDLPQESNPFLGYRAIRICLDRIDIFKTQLRAILRASAFGNIKVMFPMISNIDEFIKAKNILEETKSELRKSGIAFDEKIMVGMMVEVPSAALKAKTFAKYADFFSIGTNDLCQYTLAVDRMNSKVANLYQPFNPSVLWLIKNVIDAGDKAKIPVGMCGEMASDKKSAYLLLGLGLSSFSMGANALLGVKQVIRKTNYQKVKGIAENAINLASEREIDSYIEKYYSELE